jgi:hypothetical protein
MRHRNAKSKEDLYFGLKDTAQLRKFQMYVKVQGYKTLKERSLHFSFYISRFQNRLFPLV